MHRDLEVCRAYILLDWRQERELLRLLLVVALGQSIAGQSEFAYEDLIRMVSALHMHTEHTVAVWMQFCHPGRAEITLYRY
jgi:hypothetical protein